MVIMAILQFREKADKLKKMFMIITLVEECYNRMFNADGLGGFGRLHSSSCFS